MKNILLVDDDQRFLKTLQEELTYRGFSILTANDGKKALEALQSAPVDLVVTDLRMPVMNGIELTKEMRKNYPNVPVILMSAFLEPGEGEYFVRLGASGVVCKSLGADTLVDLIQKNL